MATTRSRVIASLYRDSVTLMRVAARIAALPGVDQATAVMATAANLALAAEAGLSVDDIETGPNDLLIAVAGDDEAVLEAALDEAVAALDRALVVGGGERPTPPPRSIVMALGEAPEANLALIATPGAYAAAEAEKALRLGLNVMLFSDNVALDDEVALKALAAWRGLLVMGPDCGTAIVDGVPLGFANAVRRGDIGIVAASGTGLQQVTCLIDRLGGGISQAIGTGGRDLDGRVGGATTLAGIAALVDDPDTAVIVLISKPPAQAVADRVLAAAAAGGKRVVACFLGTDASTIMVNGIQLAATLADAAAMAVALSAGKSPTGEDIGAPGNTPTLAPGRRYLRALYSGGAFCYEALTLLSPILGPVRSTTPLDPANALADPWRSEGHTVVDLGDDVFTRGRPHPMIDHRLRNDRILREAEDPACAVILLDVVLGHGAHPDPAAEMVPAIARARSHESPVFVASVCGTEADPQGLRRQETALREAGVLLADSNAAAARLAAAVIQGGGS